MKIKLLPKIEYKNIKDLPVKVTDWIGSISSLLVHTVFFGAMFAMYAAGFNLEKLLLVLTTIVSLEAIYLSILIQMTVNRNTQSLQEVEEDIDEIQEEIQEDDQEEAKTKATLETIEKGLQ